MVLSTSELQGPARRLYESSGYRLVREERDARSRTSRQAPGSRATTTRRAVKISVVVPAFNEEALLPGSLAAIRAAMSAFDEG